MHKNNDSDKLIERLIILTRKFSCTCIKHEEYLANNFGVSLAECRSLQMFDDLRYLTANGLAERMELGVSRITRIVDGLVKKNLAERTTDPKDRRVCLISLTNEGKNLANKLHSKYMEEYRNLISNLNPETINQALNVFQELFAEMEHIKNSK